MSFLAQLDYWHLILLIVGVAAGYFFTRLRDRSLSQAIDAQREARLENADREAENTVREAKLKANEEAQKIRCETEESFATRRKELEEADQQRAKREALLNQQMEGMVEREKNIAGQQTRLLEKEEDLRQRKQELKKLIVERREQLAEIAHLSEEEARAQFLKEVESAAQMDANELSRHIMEEVKGNTEREAKRILATAVQRYASEYTFKRPRDWAHRR